MSSGKGPCREGGPRRAGSRPRRKELTRGPRWRGTLVVGRRKFESEQGTGGRKSQCWAMRSAGRVRGERRHRGLSKWAGAGATADRVALGTESTGDRRYGELLKWGGAAATADRGRGRQGEYEGSGAIEGSRSGHVRSARRIWGRRPTEHRGTRSCRGGAYVCRRTWNSPTVVAAGDSHG